MASRVPPDAWTPRGIESLEENALVVVRSASSYSVIAGPGAGKTELLAQRACYLLETGACPAPRRILAISFKRDAARNLKERVVRRSGRALGRRLDSFTFDAFAKGVLDQFSSALPSELRPTAQYDVLARFSQPDVESVLDSMSPPSSLGRMSGLKALASAQFFDSEVPWANFDVEPTSLSDWAAREFWKVLLHQPPRSRLSFKMIMRLAGRLLRWNAPLRRAYRSTYTHAFLDEFQDTTGMQYQLTKVLFHGSGAVLTAVGDPHQRIMGWAGALSDQFDKFDADFSATSIRLERNYRANAELAPLVRFLAKEMREAAGSKDGVHRPIEPGSGPPAEACSAHRFDDECAEAAWIAAEISRLVTDGTSPRELAVLVRMKAGDYSRVLIDALAAVDIPARIEDSVQVLLTEPVIQACVLAMRAFGAKEPRGAWSQLRELLGDVRGYDLDDARRWQELEREMTQARALVLAAAPQPPTDALTLRALVRDVVEPVMAQVRSRNPEYARGTFYDECLDLFCLAIAEQYRGTTWSEVLDRFEGVGTVPILTIHKSKGLEYDAVFFLGLEDAAFWNFRRARDEEMNAFYVAVSRAKKQVQFTLCRVRERGGRAETQTQHGIAAIYDIMRAAEVKIQDHSRTG